MKSYPQVERMMQCTPPGCSSAISADEMVMHSNKSGILKKKARTALNDVRHAAGQVRSRILAPIVGALG